MKKIIEDNKPENFDNRNAINEHSNDEWQKKNITWWNKNPMEYDFSTEINFPKYSKEFYDEIDQRFYSVSRLFLPHDRLPFDRMINHSALISKNVLEIGVGAGSHASLLSAYSKKFTGIDITEEAIKNTKKRFEIMNLSGDLRKMNAERMDFEDNEFDFVWSWGVIHHSANTNQIISEVNRVLAPKGRAIVMVYHRSFLYYYIIMFIKGIGNRNFFKNYSIHKTVQLNTDGAIARYYSRKEWIDAVKEKFNIKSIKIYGQHADLIPLPAGKLKNLLAKIIPTFIMKFINTNLRQGYFLVSEIEKKS